MTLSWKNNPELQKMTLVKPKGFDIGRIGFRPVYPESNLIMCHLQEVDATRGYGCWIWENFRNFREVKCLQGCSKILWKGI